VRLLRITLRTTGPFPCFGLGIEDSTRVGTETLLLLRDWAEIVVDLELLALLESPRR